MLNRRQLRRGVVVDVPDVVMDHLEVPQALARARVERDDAVGEQVVAMTIAAIEVVFAAGGRHVDDATDRIDGELGPVVRAADGGARVFGPGVGAEFTFGGMVWNVHTRLPVRTSNARMSPGADLYS